MKPWTRETLLWIGIAVLISICRFCVLLWVSSLPPLSDVSMVYACERANTLENGIWTFITVLAIGAMFVIMHELRRRAMSDVTRHKRD